VSRQIPHPGVSCHDAGTQGVESGGTLHVMALFTHVMPYRSHRSWFAPRLHAAAHWQIILAPGYIHLARL